MLGDSRFYRINFLWQSNALFIRDLHRFDERVLSANYDSILTNRSLACGTLPVMDGALWSGMPEAGIWPVVIMPNGGSVPLAVEGSPVVQELNAMDLGISQVIQGGGRLSIVCGESNVTFACADERGQPLRLAWDMVGGAGQASAVRQVASNGIAYFYAGVNYQLRLAPGAGSCQPLSNGAIRLSPNSSGKLVLRLGGF